MYNFLHKNNNDLQVIYFINLLNILLKKFNIYTLMSFKYIRTKQNV